MRFFVFVLAALFVSSSPARAAWVKAESDHFVIYSNQSAKSVQKFAERLELFHAAMSFRFKRKNEKLSPSNRVTIYVMRNASQVRKVTDAKSRYTAGMYIPRAGATMAFVPKLRSGGSKFDLSPETILYHEYAHHFMYSLTSRSFPRWFSEGFAEFFAGVRFEKDGVGIGAPAYHRAAELAYSRNLPIGILLSASGGDGDQKKGYDAFYGQSWQLFHYLMFSTDRKGQLSAYQRQLAEGKSALVAANTAFGDLKQLDRDLDKYRKQRRLLYSVIRRTALETGSISINALSKGAAEMMPIIIQSRRGVTDEEAKKLLPKARQIALKYPNDVMVLAALAEAEVDTDNAEQALVAADKAIAIDPTNIDAHIQKIYALFKKADTEDSQEAWKAVRRQIVKTNRLENDHPIPLMQYYRWYVEQGENVPKIAVDGLDRALALAPYDQGLRMTLVRQFIDQKQYDVAEYLLDPIANNPHESKATAHARQLLEQLQNLQEEKNEDQN